MKAGGAWRFLALGMVLVVVALLVQLERRQAPIGEPVPPGGATRGESLPASGDAAIAAAFRERRSDVWVSSSGVVERLLPDDNEGSRHQRLIVRLDTGQTVLISHNIDLASPVPAREGDRLAFRGEYEWNERGGVVHWTHHDPQGRREGGYLELDGRIYR